MDSMVNRQQSLDIKSFHCGLGLFKFGWNTVVVKAVISQRIDLELVNVGWQQLFHNKNLPFQVLLLN